MDASHILDPLNDQQRSAVCSQGRSLLVLAGAGSGKTRVLVHRVAWLVETGRVSPFGILAVTFTNKAAREMRGRIEELLGLPAAGLWVGTFHGLAHRLLRQHRRDAGLAEDFYILDSDDQLRLIKRLQRRMQLDEEKWPPKQTQWWINGQKDEGLRAGNIEDYDDKYTHTLLQIYAAYEDACQQGGMVDFGEILLRAHELWLKKPALLAHYQDRFRHILVDEFQDTNAIQYAWLRLLAAGHTKEGDSGSDSGNDSGNAQGTPYKSLMVVGDDDQSIYGWRGARIENIQQFSKDFPGTEVLRLEQNYRSTATILDAANGLINHNRGRLGKELWTEGSTGEPLSLYAAFNEQDEAHFIVSQVQDWFNGGGAYSDAAILYRSNAQSRVLEDALLRQGIDYRIYGGHRFYERLEVKNALAYLRLLANRHDDTAAERVINVPTRGIGSRTIGELRSLARAEGCSLWQACVSAVNRQQLSGRAANAVLSFLRLIDDMHEVCAHRVLEEKAAHVIEHSGLKEHHKKEGPEKAASRLENLDELVNAAAGFDGGVLSETEAEPETEDESVQRPVAQHIPEMDNTSMEYLAAFLDQAALDAGETQAGEGSDAVQLMTLHSAKGLEFNLVFLAGMEEGLFPHQQSMDDGSDGSGLEEERRLCYVGITRARQKLYLCHAETRRLHGDTKLCRPSRFINEVPAELIEEVRLKNSALGNARWGAA